MAVPQELEGVIESDPEILGGALCFKGTRVPLKTMLDYVEAGFSLDRFIRGYSSIQTAQAAVLEWQGTSEPPFPWAGTCRVILIDENMDETFPESMPGHDVRHVVGMGWAGTKNGALLKKVEETGFSTFITADKNMPYQQQSMKGGSFPLIVHPNTFITQTACVPAILDLLETAQPGQVDTVEGPHPKRNLRPSL